MQKEIDVIDPYWKKFPKTRSFVEFHNHYSLEGKFINGIPWEIRQEFKTIQYMLVYSYYHYPMFELALSKLSLLLDLSIKKRLELQGLRLNSNQPLHIDELLELGSGIRSIKEKKNEIKRFKEALSSYHEIQIKDQTKISFPRFFKSILLCVNDLFFNNHFLFNRDSLEHNFIHYTTNRNERTFNVTFQNKTYLSRWIYIGSTVDINGTLVTLIGIVPIEKNILQKVASKRLKKPLVLVVRFDRWYDRKLHCVDINSNEKIIFDYCDISNTSLEFQTMKSNVLNLSEEERYYYDSFYLSHFFDKDLDFCYENLPKISSKNWV